MPNGWNIATQQRWPLEDGYSGYEFLGYAIRRLGKSRFGNEWTVRLEQFGSRETEPPALPSVDQSAIPYAEKVHILRLFTEERPHLAFTQQRPDLGLVPIHLRSRDAKGVPIIAFSLEEWTAIRSHIELVLAEAAIARDRFAAICREIARRCEAGTLKTALLLKDGRWLPLPEQDWRFPGIQSLSRRFQYLRLHPNEPFSNGLRSDANWIFVAREGSQELITPQSLPTEEKTTGERPMYRTGAPGRPSSMHLIRNEAEHRLKTGKAPQNFMEFCRELGEWLQTNHPDAPPAGPKAISNAEGLRDKHRQMVREQP